MIAALLLALAPQAPLPVEQVPRDMRTGYFGGRLRRGFQSGRISIPASCRELRIEWEASRFENDPPPWEPGGPDEEAWKLVRATNGEQRIPVDWLPTACAVLDPEIVLVAGVDDEGLTLVEAWSLSWPAKMPGVRVDVLTGESRVDVAEVERTATRTVLRRDVPGERWIEGLELLRRASGAPTHALVRFHDSGDVHALDLASGRLALVIGGESLGPLGRDPLLASGDSRSISCSDRIDTGYVYFLKSRPGAYIPPRCMYGVDLLSFPAFPALVDADRDGRIDQVLHIDGSAWKRDGWYALQSYAEWWLE